MDMGGNGEFSTKKKSVWMDMDLAERVGVEWASKFCPVKGSFSGSLQIAWDFKHFANCLGNMKTTKRARQFVNCLGILQTA